MHCVLAKIVIAKKDTTENIYSIVPLRHFNIVGIKAVEHLL